MPIACVINFDHNPHGLYFAGQLLTGRVELTLDKPKKVKGISFKISGYAECKWSEQKAKGVGKHRRTRTVWYSGREDYLATKTYFVGSEEGNQLELPAGAHSYTFSCVLPPKIPTSFEGTHGHIRYTARACLERPWKFDQTYKIAFTVLKPLDLNLEAHSLRIPAQLEVTESFGCGSCRSGPFLLTVSIPQTGYVPGQEIKINAKVTNHSKVPVEKIKFSLKKIVIYQSERPTRKAKTEIVTIQQKKMNGTMKEIYASHDVSLLIPAVPATCMHLCRVIYITYEVIVEAKMGSFNTNPKIKIPITIGTVPLQQYDNSIINRPIGIVPPIGTQQPIGFHPMPSAPTDTITSQPMASTSRSYDTVDAVAIDYPEIPPPSYEESMFGNRQIEDEEDPHPIGQQLYTPRYPVYHFNSVAQNDQRNQNGNTDPVAVHSEKLREKMSNWNES